MVLHGLGHPDVIVSDEPPATGGATGAGEGGEDGGYNGRFGRGGPGCGG